MVEKLNGNASLFHAPKYVNIRLERDTDLNQLVRVRRVHKSRITF